MNGVIARLLVVLFVCGLVGIAAANAQPLIPVLNGFVGTGGFARDDSGHFFLSDVAHNLLQEIAAPGSAPQPLGVGLGLPFGVAADGAGNVFVVDNQNGVIKELLAASGYLTTRPIGSGFSEPMAVVLDKNGNVFVADGVYLKEVTAASGYQTVITLSNAVQSAKALALDAAGNLFAVTATQLWKIPAAGGYSSARQLGASFTDATSIALDPSDNVFITDSGALTVDEVPAAGGYAKAEPFITDIPKGLTLAIDKSGDIFAADPTDQFIAEFLASTGYTQFYAYKAGFFTISAIALDPDGNLFIADSGNSSVKELYVSSGYTTGLLLENGFAAPGMVALDQSGNVFVGDRGGLKFVSASSGYAVVATIWPGIIVFTVDQKGNVFLFDGTDIIELTVASGYADAVTVSSGFSRVQALTVDNAGNLYVYDYSLFILDADSGYANVRKYSPETNVSEAANMVIDGNGNVFFGSVSGVWELPVGNYAAPVSVIGVRHRIGELALDRAGDLLIYDATSPPPAIYELPPSPLVASVLPAARSVVTSGTATVFATIVNTGSAPLTGCQIGTPYFALDYGLQLQYQPTNPTTNIPIGQIDTPVTIPGQSAQSFVVTLWSDQDGVNWEFYVPDLSLRFFCDGPADAAVVVGVNTIDLNMNADPGADIISIIATPTNDGVMQLPSSGAGAFAIATSNLGTAQSVTASIDTGAATLPLSVAICQTDPTTGQCLTAPALSLPVSFAAGDAPTFSAFLQAGGAIPLAPASSRVFIRFTDASGTIHGATSVAIEAQ